MAEIWNYETIKELLYAPGLTAGTFAKEQWH